MSAHSLTREQAAAFSSSAADCWTHEQAGWHCRPRPAARTRTCTPARRVLATEQSARLAACTVPLTGDRACARRHGPAADGRWRGPAHARQPLWAVPADAAAPAGAGAGRARRVRGQQGARAGAAARARRARLWHAAALVLPVSVLPITLLKGNACSPCRAPGSKVRELACSRWPCPRWNRRILTAWLALLGASLRTHATGRHMKVGMKVMITCLSAKCTRRFLLTVLDVLLRLLWIPGRQCRGRLTRACEPGLPPSQ